jgi:hypothetical protein
VDAAEQGKTITAKGARFGLQVSLPPGVTLAYDKYAMNLEARFLPKGAPHDNQASWLQLTVGKPSWVTASEGCISVRTRAGTTEDCNLHMTSGSTLNVGLTSLGSMFDADILGTPEVKINAAGAGRTGSMSSSAWGEKVVIGGDYEVKRGADTYPVQSRSRDEARPKTSGGSRRCEISEEELGHPDARSVCGSCPGDAITHAWPVFAAGARRGGSTSARSRRYRGRGRATGTPSRRRGAPIVTCRARASPPST